MAKTLEMTFKTEAGKDATFSISEPKENLTLSAVQAAATTCITPNVFENVTVDLASLDKSQIKEVTLTSLA